MGAEKRAPIREAATSTDGLASAHAVHSDFSSTLDTYNSTTTPTALAWSFLTPQDLQDADRLHRAALKAVARIHNAFAESHSMARLHNECLQLAREIRALDALQRASNG